MNSIIIFALAVAGIVSGQDVLFEEAISWPQNDYSLGGTIVDLRYSGLEDGTCVVQLPEIVNLFHVMNGFIVTGDASNPAEAVWKISAPMHWNLVNGTFKVLIIFDRDLPFDLDQIDFTCNPADVRDLAVYSFPQNNLIQEASSTICYRPGFHINDVVTVTFPVRVAEFNVTSGRSDYEVTTDDYTSFTIRGFQAPPENNYHTEISFHLLYAVEEGVETWFSAGDISITIGTEDAPIPIDIK